MRLLRRSVCEGRNANPGQLDLNRDCDLNRKLPTRKNAQFELIMALAAQLKHTHEEPNLEAPADIFQPYWDYGPSARHTKSIQLLSETEVRGLDGGESFVTHWKALMRHIETNSAPVLSQISSDTAGRRWQLVQRKGTKESAGRTREP